MAYDSAKVFAEVRRALDRSPHTSLSDLARQLGVARHTVERSVRAQAGQPFRDFRSTLMVARALELLAEPRPRSIKEISALLGFGSASSFGRFILRSTGKTPTKLRAELTLGTRPTRTGPPASH